MPDTLRYRDANKSIFVKLIDHYKSLDSRDKLAQRVLNDPNASRVAQALDMSEAEYFNMMIKVMAVEGKFLEQEVIIPVLYKGKKIQLPLKQFDGEPLKYKKFIGLRSGPLFGGVLNPNRAKHYANESQTEKYGSVEEFQQFRREQAEKHLDKIGPLQQGGEDLIIKFREDFITYYQRPSDASRHLSDIDMVPRSLLPLKQGIINALNDSEFMQKKVPGYEDVEYNEYALNIAIEAMWQNSGYINLDKLSSLDAEDIQFDFEQLQDLQESNVPQRGAPSLVVLGTNKASGLGAMLQENWIKSLVELGIEEAEEMRGTLVPTNNTRANARRATLLPPNVNNRETTLENNAALEAVPLGDSMEFMAPLVAVSEETGAVIRQGGKVTFNTNKAAYEEYGDVITDAKSSIADFINHHKNYENAVRRFYRAFYNNQQDLAKKSGKKYKFPSDEHINKEVSRHIGEAKRGSRNKVGENPELDFNIYLEAEIKKINDTAKSYRHSKLDETEQKYIDALETIRDEFISNREFIESTHLCEEIAKKEAQMVIFKAERDDANGDMVIVNKRNKKIVGNISDVTNTMDGIVKMQNNANQQSFAKALNQLISLSYLVTLPRWGVAAANINDNRPLLTLFADINNKDIMDPAFYMSSLNERSYESNSENNNGVRKNIGWNNINYDESVRRIGKYEESFKSLWQFVHDNGEDFFTSIDEYAQKYKECIETNANAGTETVWNDLAGMRLNVKNAISGLVSQSELFGDLTDQIEQFQGDGSVDRFIDSLTEDAIKSVVFSISREKSIVADLEEGLEVESTTSQEIEVENNIVIEVANANDNDADLDPNEVSGDVVEEVEQGLINGRDSFGY